MKVFFISAAISFALTYPAAFYFFRTHNYESAVGWACSETELQGNNLLLHCEKR